MKDEVLLQVVGGAAVGASEPAVLLMLLDIAYGL